MHEEAFVLLVAAVKTQAPRSTSVFLHGRDDGSAGEWRLSRRADQRPRKVLQGSGTFDRRKNGRMECSPRSTRRSDGTFDEPDVFITTVRRTEVLRRAADRGECGSAFGGLWCVKERNGSGERRGNCLAAQLATERVVVKLSSRERAF